MPTSPSSAEVTAFPPPVRPPKAYFYAFPFSNGPMEHLVLFVFKISSVKTQRSFLQLILFILQYTLEFYPF